MKAQRLILIWFVIAGQHVLACEPTLQHLSSRIPRYNDSDLNAVREAILATDIKSALAQARAQGFSAPEAIAAAREQARQAAEQARQAGEAAIAIAADEAWVKRVLQAVDEGGLLPADTLPFSGTITSQNIKTYILATWSRIANEEAAQQMNCFTGSNPVRRTETDRGDAAQAARLAAAAQAARLAAAAEATRVAAAEEAARLAAVRRAQAEARQQERENQARLTVAKQEFSGLLDEYRDAQRAPSAADLSKSSGVTDGFRDAAAMAQPTAKTTGEAPIAGVAGEIAAQTTKVLVEELANQVLGGKTPDLGAAARSGTRAVINDTLAEVFRAVYDAALEKLPRSQQTDLRAWSLPLAWMTGNVAHIKATYSDFIEKEIAAPMRAFTIDGGK